MGRPRTRCRAYRSFEGTQSRSAKKGARKDGKDEPRLLRCATPVPFRDVLGYPRVPMDWEVDLRLKAYRYPNSRSYSLCERISRIRTTVPTPGAD